LVLTGYFDDDSVHVRIKNNSYTTKLDEDHDIYVYTPLLMDYTYYVTSGSGIDTSVTEKTLDAGTLYSIMVTPSYFELPEVGESKTIVLDISECLGSATQKKMSQGYLADIEDLDELTVELRRSDGTNKLLATVTIYRS